MIFILSDGKMWCVHNMEHKQIQVVVFMMVVVGWLVFGGNKALHYWIWLLIDWLIDYIHFIGCWDDEFHVCLFVEETK